MQEWTEFIKALIRPYIIFIGWPILGIGALAGVEFPLLFTSILSAFTLEYGIERAVKRFKEK